MKNRIAAALVAVTLGIGGAFASAGAASAAEVEPAAATAPSYWAALWEASPNLQPKFPQTLVANTPLTTSTDVHQLDSAATKCGTTYQFDLYAYDKLTNALITKGVLNGSGDESWPGGSYQPQFSNVFTTAACPPPPVDCTVGPVKSDPVCAVEVVIPQPTPPTCSTDGDFTALTSAPPAQNPNGYEFGKYRFYIAPAFAGPGTYELTLQKVGGYKINAPHFSGEKISVTVLPKSGNCPTTVTAPPVDEQLPTPAVLAETGPNPLVVGMLVLAIAALLSLGSGLLIIERRRALTSPRYRRD